MAELTPRVPSERVFGIEAGLTSGKSGPSGSAGASPLCPQCHSAREHYRDGLRYLTDGSVVQRWLCRDCGLRFSDPEHVKQSSINVEEITRNSKQSIKAQETIALPRQICDEESKNLGFATETKTVAGEFGKRKPLPTDAKGALTKFAAYLEREGYSKESQYPNFLAVLVRKGANLADPEDVKEKVAKHPKWKDSSKMLAVHAYGVYCKMEGIQWTMPRYKQNEATIYLPDSEREFDQLISFARSRRLRAFLQAIRETYADPSEILWLEWKDLKDDSISINKPCKGHRPGVKEVNRGCIAMLRALPKTDKRIFPCTYRAIYGSFKRVRIKAAAELQNEQLLNINFKTFRHWAGTQIAWRTNGNGLLTIQKELRHKEIKSTLKYIHSIPTFREIDYDIATASTPEEIMALGKAGFEKYDEAHGVHYYRRVPRKSGQYKAEPTTISFYKNVQEK